MSFESCLQASLGIFPSSKPQNFYKSHDLSIERKLYTTTRTSFCSVLRSFKSQSLHGGGDSELFPVLGPLNREKVVYDYSPLASLALLVPIATYLFIFSTYFFILSTLLLHTFHVFPLISSYSFIFLHIFHIFLHIFLIFPF